MTPWRNCGCEKPRIDPGAFDDLAWWAEQDRAQAIRIMTGKMSRSIPSPEIQKLAERLVSYEAGKNSSAGEIPLVFPVSEKLRRPLSALVGVAGFNSLLSRALALARKEVPGLSAVQIKPDGSLEGLKEVDQGQTKGRAMLIAQLLGLLVTFIGESLMMKIVVDAWPDIPAVDTVEKEQ